MAAEREQIVRLLADEPNWATVDDFLRAVKAAGLHLVTDADLRVLELLGKQSRIRLNHWVLMADVTKDSIDIALGELAEAELARRGEKP